MADHSMQESLRKALSFLEAQKYDYALIGGIANQVWGQARFTYDIDIKILVPELRYEAVQCRIATAFPEPGRPDLPANPFVVSVRVGGIIVDFLLAARVMRSRSSQGQNYGPWVTYRDCLNIRGNNQK